MSAYVPVVRGAVRLDVEQQREANGNNIRRRRNAYGAAGDRYPDSPVGLERSPTFEVARDTGGP